MCRTHKVSLTSWFSWKSTKYSERCCLMNFLMISCLIRGSRTLATKQASLRTMLGPPDFCKYQIKCVTGMIQRDLLCSNTERWLLIIFSSEHCICTFDPWAGKVSSKSASICVPSSLCAALTLRRSKTDGWVFTRHLVVSGFPSVQWVLKAINSWYQNVGI